MHRLENIKKLLEKPKQIIENSSNSKILSVGGTILIGTGVVISIPYFIGFGSAGIVGGSTAAAIQSSIGNVAVGSTFSALQSLGATGVLA